MNYTSIYDKIIIIIYWSKIKYKSLKLFYIVSVKNLW